MQLARLKYNLETRSISGKLKQMWRAYVIERHYSKLEILTAYFNYAPYGGSIEGLGAAAAIYFQKEAKHLTHEECLALTIIPQSPTIRLGLQGNSFVKAYNRVAKSVMKEKTSLDRVRGISDAEPSLNEIAMYRPPTPRATLPPHLARHLTQNRYGSFHTTIDKEFQIVAEKTLESYLHELRPLGVTNGAILAVNGGSGEVLGYVGSSKFSDPLIQGFVDGVRASRSPGSLLKPLIYAKAISEGVIIPESKLTDIPIKLTNYAPENFERNFQGLMSAKDALIKSRNVPAILLNLALKERGLYQILRDASLNLPKNEDYYGASIVLGGFEISLFKVVELYTSFINGGEIKRLSVIKNELNRNKPSRLFSSESAYLTREMLRHNPPPISYNDELQQISLTPKTKVDWKQTAWKTGTSSGGRDAWAIGIKGDLIIGVWLGNFNGQGNANLIGRDLAGPLLFRLFATSSYLPALKDFTAGVVSNDTYRKISLTNVLICATSGEVAQKFCPSTKEVKAIPGVSPIKRCNMHRSEIGDPVFTSLVEDHLRSVGSLKPKEKTFNLSTKQVSPHIILPQKGLKYLVSDTASSPNQNSKIPFQAELDGEANKAFWYVNDELISEVSPGQLAFWPPKIGTFTVSVVDNFGSTDSVKIAIEPLPQ
jgi:penicillin-binding protein 1C